MKDDGHKGMCGVEFHLCKAQKEGKAKLQGLGDASLGGREVITF